MIRIITTKPLFNAKHGDKYNNTLSHFKLKKALQAGTNSSAFFR